jgi:hypothetical protein
MPGIDIGGKKEDDDPNSNIPQTNNNNPAIELVNVNNDEENKKKQVEKDQQNKLNAAVVAPQKPIQAAVQEEKPEATKGGKAKVRAGKKPIEMLPIVLEVPRDLFEAFKQMARGASWSATFAQLNGKPWVKSIMNGPVGFIVNKIFQEDPKLKENVKGFSKENKDNDNSQQQSVGETTNNISKSSNKNNFPDRLSKVTNAFKSISNSGTANNKVDKSPVVFSNLLDPNLGNNGPEPKKTLLDKIKETVTENKNNKYKKLK